MTTHKTPYEMVAEFHEIFDPRKPAQPTAFDGKEALFRAGFKVEELVEFLFAASGGERRHFDELVAGLHEAVDQAQSKVLKKMEPVSDPLVAQTDALTDLLYLTYGSFALMGVDPQPIMAIVHEANMGKLFPDGQPHYDPITNKVMKPANWAEAFAPEAKIKKELQRQTQAAQSQRLTEER